MEPDKHPELVVPELVERELGWSRDAALQWLLTQAEQCRDMLIGIDMSAALPFADAGAYFPGWDKSPPDAKSLWKLVSDICADDPHLSATSFVAHAAAYEYFRHSGYLGSQYGVAKSGRLRIVEQHSRLQRLANPYSSLNLVGAAQVGKSSLTCMRVLHRVNSKIPVWPFDPIPETGPLIVEIYTSIAAVAAGLRRGRTKIRDRQALDRALHTLDSKTAAPLLHYDDHKTDALITTAWLAKASRDRLLWSPKAMSAKIATTEGWTFGVF